MMNKKGLLPLGCLFFVCLDTGGALQWRIGTTREKVRDVARLERNKTSSAQSWLPSAQFSTMGLVL
jgi:hypothetical protein